MKKDKFQIFIDEHQKWVKSFGLGGWKCYYHKVSKTTDFYAQTTPTLVSRVCKVEVSDALLKKESPEIQRTALHEAIHLLNARLWKLSKERFVSQDDLDDAEEELTRKIEYFILESLLKI